MRLERIDAAGGVEIAVLLLRRADLRNQSIEVGVKLGIGMHAQCVGRAFDDLVDIGIVERIWRVLLVFERLTAKSLGGADKIVDAPGLFVFAECERNGDRAVDLDPRRPESVVDVDGGEGYRLDRIVALLGAQGEAQKNEYYCNRFHPYLVYSGNDD